VDLSGEKRFLDTGRIHEFAAFAIMPHPFQIIQGAKANMIGDQYAVRTIPRDDPGPAPPGAEWVGRLALGGGHFSA
jgi:hypothetical protein